MRNFVTFDDSNFPIVVEKYADFLPTLEEFLKAQQDCENFYSTHTDFIVLIDLSGLTYLPYEYRVLQAKWVEHSNALYAKQKIRFVFYTPSVSLRLMLKTLFALTTVSVPYAVTPTLEKAHAWARKQLAIKL